MLLRPAADDLRVVGDALGRILVLAGLAASIPLAWALVAREWHPLGSFLLMAGIFLAFGTSLVWVSTREASAMGTEQGHLDWSHGMVVVAVAWLVVPAVGSIPFALSGHFASPLDAYFDAMSGLTTTGLALVADVDHLASSLNFWRHLLQFLGGQGIIMAALVVFAGRGGTTLFHGEGRDDRVLPSVQSTAKAIWAVSFLHLVAGVVALSAVAFVLLGFTWNRALFHGLMVFFAAFDTGGFSPQSTSIGYYHSAVFEAVTAVLMVAGALSFGFHFRLWSRSDGRYGARSRSTRATDPGTTGRRSLLKNLETRTILTTFVLTLGLTMFGLAAIGAYSSVAGLSRQGFFQILSAHTGTGFSTIPSSELAMWSGLAFGAMAIAMALGGMASSTAGGVKAIRIGVTVRGIANQVRGDLLPEGAIVDDTYHQFGQRRLTAEVARSAMTVSLLFVALYLLGAGVGIAYGVPLQDALFESVSASANVGLSVGVTEPTMPLLLKVTYILQMWLGRLEFIAAFVLFGFLYALVRGKS
jgi:trk system potassium uptake protein TrkH